MCANDQCLKILLSNKVAREKSKTDLKQWEASGQSR